MTNKKGMTIRYIYGVFLSLLTVFVGALFIMQTWSIYRSAPQSPYTVENISAHFAEIALPVWIWVAAIIVHVVLAFAFPEAEARVTVKADNARILARLQARLPLETWSEETLSACNKQSKRRKAVTAICVVFMITSGAACLATLSELFYTPIFKTSFFAAHNGLVDRIVQCAILTTVALFVGYAAAALRARSVKRETEILKREAARQKNAEKEKTAFEPLTAEDETQKNDSKWTEFFNSFMEAFVRGEVQGEKELYPQLREILRKTPKQTESLMPKKSIKERVKREKKNHAKLKTAGVWSARILLCAVGVCLVVVGIQNGGMRDVLLKAINICTQCIGLG